MRVSLPHPWRTSCRGRGMRWGSSRTPTRSSVSAEPRRAGPPALGAVGAEPHGSGRADRRRGRAARAIDLLKRRGLLIVISDLYDERDAVERSSTRAAHIGHEVVVFHMLTGTRSSFRSGRRGTEDPETGRLSSPTAPRRAGRTGSHQRVSSSDGARGARRMHRLRPRLHGHAARRPLRAYLRLRAVGGVS